jgi:hypothetical protein
MRFIFQPGTATNPKYTWRTAFSIFRESGRPMLLSAYDQDDAERDVAVVCRGNTF